MIVFIVIDFNRPEIFNRFYRYHFLDSIDSNGDGYGFFGVPPSMGSHFIRLSFIESVQNAISVFATDPCAEGLSFFIGLVINDGYAKLVLFRT